MAKKTTTKAQVSAPVQVPVVQAQPLAIGDLSQAEAMGLVNAVASGKILDVVKLMASGKNPMADALRDILIKNLLAKESFLATALGGVEVIAPKQKGPATPAKDKPLSGEARVMAILAESSGQTLTIKGLAKKANVTDGYSRKLMARYAKEGKANQIKKGDTVVFEIK